MLNSNSSKYDVNSLYRYNEPEGWRHFIFIFMKTIQLKRLQEQNTNDINFTAFLSVLIWLFRIKNLIGS